MEQYPLDHDPLVDQAAQEQDEDAQPELSIHIENLEQYDTIFLGYPNWWGDIPQALYTFLEEYGIDPQDIPVMGFSAGGILSGEMLLNYDGDILPTVLALNYQPDELDSVSANTAEQAGVLVEPLQLDNMPHGFGTSGDWIPTYDQWLTAVFNK